MTAAAQQNGTGWDWRRLQRDLVAREHLIAELPAAAQIRCAVLAIERIAPWWEQALRAGGGPVDFSGLPRRMAADVRSFITQDLPEQPDGLAALAAWTERARSVLDGIKSAELPQNLPQHLVDRLWWPLYYFVGSVHIWGRHALPGAHPVTSMARAVAATVWQAGIAIAEYRAMVNLGAERVTPAVEDLTDQYLEQFVHSTWRDCEDF